LKNSFKHIITFTRTLSAILLSLLSVKTHAQWINQSTTGGINRFDAPAITIGDYAYRGCGAHAGVTYDKDFLKYNPGSKTWTTETSYPGGGGEGVFAFALNGKAYYGGGNTVSNEFQDFWEYNPGTGGWTEKANFPVALSYCSAFVVGDTAYVGLGGSYTFGTFNNTKYYKYDPSSDTWSPIKDFPGAGRWRAIAFTIGNFGYVTCGVNSNSGTFYNDFYKYDPSLGKWTLLPAFPGSARELPVFSVLCNKGIVGMGDGTPSAPYTDLWMYDPNNGALGSWTELAGFNGGARYATNGFTLGDTIYVAGGLLAGASTAVNDLWYFTPNLISVSNNVTICYGGSTVLSANGNSIYNWYPSTGLSVSLTTSGIIPGISTQTMANPLATTTYTVTEAICGLQYKSVQVVVNSSPTVVVFPASITLCSGSSTTFTAFAPGATGFAWSPATALNNFTVAIVTANPTTTTIYQVTASNATGCGTSSVLVTVPYLNVSPNASICVGNVTRLSAIGSGGYLWSPSATLSSATSSLVIAGPTVTTTYTVTETYCNESVSRKITVNTLPTITFSPSNVSICFGSRATLTAAGAQSYSWNPSSGLSSPNSNVVTANPGTTTSYTVIGTDANGCINSSGTKVTVFSIPTLITSSGAVLCLGNSATLSASGSASSYFWSPSTGLNQTTGASVVATPTVGGTYNYVVTTSANANGCVDSNSISVTVHSLPQVSILPFPSSAFSSSSKFQVSIGGATNNFGNSVQQTSGGGYIVAGTYNNGANNDVYLIKTDASGNITWAKIYDLGSDEYGQSVQVIPGGYVVVGYTYLSSSGYASVFLLTTDASGNVTAANYIDESGNAQGDAFGYSVLPSNGGYYVTGYVNDGNWSGNPDVYLLYTDGSLNYQWSNYYDFYGDDYGYSIMQATDGSGGYVIAGSTDEWGDANDVLLLETDVNGNLQWSSEFDFYNDEVGKSIIAATDGSNGYVIAGYSNSYNEGANYDALLLETDNQGNNILWSSFFDAGSDDYGSSVQPGNSGYIITGYSDSYSPGNNVYLVQTDNGGNYQWSKGYGGGNNDYGNSVWSTTDGGYIIAGNTGSFGLGGNDVYLIKTDANGSSGGCNESNPGTNSGYSAGYQNNQNDGCNQNGGSDNGSTVSPNVTNGGQAVLLCPTTRPVICSGNTINLYATGSANSYVWTPPAGLNSSTGALVIATLTVTATYTVVGTDGNSCTSSASITIAMPSLVISNPASICQGSGQTLSVIGSSGYIWVPSATLSSSTGTFVTASPTVTTTYTVTEAYCSKYISTTVGVYGLPILLTSPDLSLCQGISASLSCSGAILYTWSPSIGLNATTGNNVTVNPPGIGLISYTITGTNTSTTCSNNAAININVNALPTILVSANSTICLGTNTDLSATGAVTYLWSPSATLNINTGALVISTLITAGNYTYSVSGTDINACVNHASVLVTADTPTLTISGGTSICSGSQQNLSIFGSATDYVWAPSATLSSSTGAFVTANPTVNTSYTVTGTDGFGCSSSVSTILDVNAIPLLSTSANATICQGFLASLSCGGAENYAWQPATGLSATNSSNVTANPPPGTYSYTVTGTNADMCGSSAVIVVNVNATPTANAGFPQDVCIGNPASLSASGGLTYIWSPATYLNSITGANVTAFPTVLGIYEYTVTVSDVNGCMDIDTVSVSVKSSLTANAGNNQSICSGTSTTLIGLGGSTYTWSPATGLSTTTGNSTQFSITSPGTYSYTLTVASGNCSSTGSVTVTVLNLPTITVSPGATVCLGNSTVLSAGGTGIVAIAWSPALGLSSATGASVNAAPSASSVYVVMGTNANHCSSSADVNVTVTVNPLPIVSVTPNNMAICFGDSTTLTASGITGQLPMSYLWTSPTSLLPDTGAMVTVQPLTTSSYTVTGTDGNGCYNTASANVNVIPALVITVSPANAVSICMGLSTMLTVTGAVSYNWSPSTALNNTNTATVTSNPTTAITYIITGTTGTCSGKDSVTIGIYALPSIIASPDVTICTGNTAELSASGAISYNWNPATTPSTGTQVSANPNATTTYTVTGTDANNCQNYALAEVSVAIPIQVATSPDLTIITGTSAVISATNSGSSYSWIPADDLSCNTCQSTTASPTATTVYSVTMIDVNGCSSSATVAVDVIPFCGNLFVPDAFSPNGDGLNDVLTVQIQAGCLQSLTLQVYDRWGNKVFDSENNQSGSSVTAATYSWDGKYKGKEMDDAVFVYQLQAALMDGTTINKKGNISLIK